jgi:hypothetical protein
LNNLPILALVGDQQVNVKKGWGAEGEGISRCLNRDQSILCGGSGDASL